MKHTWAIILTGGFFGCSCEDPIPPAAPAPPAPGIQNREDVPIQRRPCVDEVRIALEKVATAASLATSISHRSDMSLDVDLLPSGGVEAIGATAVDQYEAECYLFSGKYRNDALARRSLRDYIVRINLDWQKVNPGELQTVGFAGEDVNHLTEHLQRFGAGERNPSLRAANPHPPPDYSGVRYYRVTYSHRPKSEFSVNVGTTREGMVLTSSQAGVRSTIHRAVYSASRCAPP